MQYELDRSALLKILLHAAGHPSQSVNGVLLGKAFSKVGKVTDSSSNTSNDSKVHILDVLPFFHTYLSLAPMTEVALIQADAYAQKQGMSLIGYYHANERIDDLELGPSAWKIADRIHANSPGSCALLVDNSKLQAYLQEKDKEVLQIFTKDIQRGGAWMQVSSSSLLSEASTVPKLFMDYHSQGRHHEIIDFDDHLNDIRKDWTNATLLT